MHIMKCLTFLFSLIVVNASGQQFVKLADSLAVSSFASGIYGSGISLFDWNLDGYDDIVLLQEDSLPSFYLNNEGEGFSRISFEGVDVTGEIKSVNWVDFNNDGNPDLSFNVHNGGPELLLNLGDFVFQNITELSGIRSVDTDWGFFHSWGDYDRDGLPDLMVTNYNFDLAESCFNYLYRNNGDLTFTDVTAQAGIHQEDEPTFIGMWSDYDNDMEPDLFLLNDRSTWRNFLYRNSGDGNFVEKGVSANMDDFMDSMSGTIGDYNNDGYFDIYITNTPINGNKLFRNSSAGIFSEISSTMNVQMFQWSWGAVWVDYDNDGWQDLFVVTQPFIGFGAPGNHYLFKNLQNTFEWQPLAGFQPSAGFTYATGRADFNNDGFPDLLTHSKLPLGTEIWMNTASTGNYLKVRLQGVISNRDAIGARLEMSAASGKQYRYIYCGEQFISQNSQWQHFGLGQDNQVDTLTVLWPSGHIDRFFNLEVNNALVLVEGSSLTNELSIIQGQTGFCQGDSIILSAGEWDSYLWSNGDTTQQTTINHTQNAHVTVFNGEFYIPSDTLFIEEFTSPVIDANVIHPACFGNEDGSLSLLLDSANFNFSLEWSNGASTSYITGLGSGEYSVEVIFAAGCQHHLDFTLIDPMILSVDSINLELTHAEEPCQLSYLARPVISVGQAPYFIEWSVYTDMSEEPIFISMDDTLSCAPVFPMLNIQCLVHDASGCSDSLVIQTTEITSVHSKHTNIQIKPNPFQEVLIVEGVSHNSGLFVYNALGIRQTIEYLELSDQKRILSFNSLSAGIYSLVISDEESNSVFKIIKK